MLQIAQYDSKVISPVHETVNLSQIITKSVIAYEPYVFDHGKILKSDIKDDICLSGNASKLKQLIDILIDNAQKYSDPDSTIYVSLKSSHNSILLMVQSTGNPITDEEAKHIFDRFYRSDNARQKSSGYGLGLSIALMIVEEHNGKIWVETKDNTNNFYVQLKK